MYRSPRNTERHVSIVFNMDQKSFCLPTFTKWPIAEAYVFFTVIFLSCRPLSNAASNLPAYGARSCGH